MIDLEELERLAKAADPLKWSVAPRESTYKVCDSDPTRQALLEAHGMDRFQAVSVGTPRGQIANIPLDESSRENAAFIAAAHPVAVLELIAEVRRLRAALSTPIAMEIKWSPIESSMMSGFSEMVGADSLTRKYDKAKSVTVYYGEKRVYTSMAAFCAAHPKEGV